MRKNVKRGYCQNDIIDFNEKNLIKLKKASEECLYLLDHDYKIKNATIFVGNHYLLSERQRLSIARSLCKTEDVTNRKNKINKNTKGITVNIDGFNAIIPLETALSGSLILECMDGSIRDLADLKGTYQIIEKTELAVNLIIRKLKELNIEKANIYLDKPISNSGRLKSLIMDIAKKNKFNVNVELIDHVDQFLYEKENVITGDSVILNKCVSWINLYKMIIDEIDYVWKIKLIEI